MSLVSIFCSFIRRLDFLDIQARPIGFPGVLLAGVANRGKDNWVYVNVFAGGKILEQLELQRMLSDMGLTMEPSYIAPASAKEMVRRLEPFASQLFQFCHADLPSPYRSSASLATFSPPFETVTTEDKVPSLPPSTQQQQLSSSSLHQNQQPSTQIGSYQSVKPNIPSTSIS